MIDVCKGLRGVRRALGLGLTGLRSATTLAGATAALALGLVLPSPAQAQDDPRPYAYAPAGPAGLLQPLGGLATDPGPDAAWVRISRDAARQGAARGELGVELPDGQRARLRVTGEESGPDGEWILIGRVDTLLGEQAAVITFGRAGAFGLLPAPDGRQFSLSTSHGIGRIAPAGGMLPEGVDADELAPDVMVPPLHGHAAGQTGSGALHGHDHAHGHGHGHSHGHAHGRIVPRGGAAPSSATTAAASGAPGDEALGGPAVVDVLAGYTPDYVALRGSVDAVRTEITHLMTLANLALADSGAVSRFNLVASVAVPVSVDATNLQALEQITQNQLGGFDLHALRDAHAADLVALLRPYRNGHGSCGVAWLNGAGLNPNVIDAAYGYSVNNVDPCGPYVLAHELGHNLGSHHDEETVRSDGWGTLTYGAYPYSFGYRQDGPPAFGTVMAYTLGDQAWIGRFSHAGGTACLGVACGIQDRADNVRSIDLMAARVARFRDPPGTISVSGASVLEGNSGSTPLQFQVRLASPAPAGGVRFDIATRDGTAIAGSDYVARQLSGVTIPQGQQTFAFLVHVLGDLVPEPDEYFEVVLSNVVGASIHEGVARGVIRNDDPALVLSGRLDFMSGAAPPSTPVSLTFRVLDDEEVRRVHTVANPPGFAYSVDLRAAGLVALEWADVPDPFIGRERPLGRIEASTQLDIPIERKLSLSGRIVFPAGATPPDTAIAVFVMGWEGVPGAGMYMAALPPDFTYGTFVHPNAALTLELQDRMPAPFLRPQLIQIAPLTQDLVRDIAVQAGTTVRGRLRFAAGSEPPFAEQQVMLAWDQSTVRTIASPPDYRFAVAVPRADRPLSATVYADLPFRWTRDFQIGLPRAAEVDIPVALAPVLRVDDAVVVGNGTTSRIASFNLHLDAPAPPGGVFVQATTRNLSAVAPGDFLAVDQSVHIPEGATQTGIAVTVQAGSPGTVDKVFALELHNPLNARLGRSTANGILRSGDASALPMLWINDASALEGNAGDSPLHVDVGLSRPAPAGGIAFDLTVTDGTAIGGRDYRRPAPQRIQIAAGQSGHRISVPVIGNLDRDGDRSFNLAVANPSGAGIARAQATATIVDDDGTAPPTPQPDHYAVAAGRPTVIPPSVGVLANDSHPLRDRLRAFDLTHNQPRHGSLSFSQDGGFTYYPLAGYTGPDRFAYNACHFGSCSITWVDLTVRDALDPADRYFWNVPPARDLARHGFMRFSNLEGRPGLVEISAIDATGRSSAGTVLLPLEAFESKHITAQDLETGNPARGMSGSLGRGSGDWVLTYRSDVAVESMAFLRTFDGFLTSIHDRVDGDGVDWYTSMFNPAENVTLASTLRLVNTSLETVEVIIEGIDDAGQAGESPVVLAIAPLSTRELNSVELEAGTAPGTTGRLGDGVGKWQLRVSSTGRITVQSLLRGANHRLTNMSTHADFDLQPGGARMLWMVPGGWHPSQEALVRLVNLSAQPGTVTLRGIDDTGAPSPGTLTVHLPARGGVHLNSGDLERGNSAKNAQGGLGRGQGNWRIAVDSELTLDLMAFARTPNGFLTTMHDLVDEVAPGRWRVPMLNPATNTVLSSRLRIVNPGSSAAHVVIRGTDDGGRPGGLGEVSLAVPAGAAIELSAVDLEQGNPAKGLVGRLGAGQGKWVLDVESAARLRLVKTMWGGASEITNLSTGSRGPAAELDP